MEATEQAFEQVYPLKLGKLVGKTVGYAVALLVLAALIYAFAQQESWGTCIFFGVVALVFALLMGDAISKLAPKRRIAVGISHAGLRIPVHKVTVPWEDIERIVFVFTVLGVGQTAGAVRALGGNQPHVLVFRRSGDMKELLGPKARYYAFAMADEMAGGRAGYCQMARELVEWGAAKGVRVSSHTDVDGWSREPLGNPPVAEAAEMTPEFRT